MVKCEGCGKNEGKLDKDSGMVICDDCLIEMENEMRSEAEYQTYQESIECFELEQGR